MEASLKEIRDLLEEDEAQERKLQELLGKVPPPQASPPPPSPGLAEVSKECSKYMEVHEKASFTNTELHKAMNLHIGNLRLLSGPLEQVRAALPSPTLTEGERCHRPRSWCPVPRLWCQPAAWSSASQGGGLSPQKTSQVGSWGGDRGARDPVAILAHAWLYCQQCQDKAPGWLLPPAVPSLATARPVSGLGPGRPCWGSVGSGAAAQPSLSPQMTSRCCRT